MEELLLSATPVIAAVRRECIWLNERCCLRPSGAYRSSYRAFYSRKVGSKIFHTLLIRTE